MFIIPALLLSPPFFPLLLKMLIITSLSTAAAILTLHLLSTPPRIRFVYYLCPLRENLFPGMINIGRRKGNKGKRLMRRNGRDNKIGIGKSYKEMLLCHIVHKLY